MNKKSIDTNLIIDLYINKKKSSREIATILGVTKSTVLRKLKNANVERRNDSILQNLKDKSYGLWKVKSKAPTPNNIKNSNNKGAYWNCECSCGNKGVISGQSLRNGSSTSCGCNKKKKLFKGYEDLSGFYWYRVKSGAEKRGLDFSITMEYAWDLFIKQDKKCNLTGLPITLTKDILKSYKYHTASIDRIDSSKGYIEGNVQWIHSDVNIMKNSFSEKHFINLCFLVSKNVNDVDMNDEIYLRKNSFKKG